MAKKFSGIQRQVLDLYRNCIRAAYSKPVEFKQNWLNYIHDEFNKHRKIPRRNFSAIEHLLRVGDRRFEMYKSPLIKNVN